jgi:putative holliday junction resolvase
MARSLGLDVGNRRIGVAVSDATKLIARPLCVIDRKVEDALTRLRALVAEHAPDEIVMGYPYHADGRVSEQAKAVEAFAEVLRPVIDIPIRYHDERHSSQDARAIIADKRRKQQPTQDDAIAASVILQRYLDAQRPLGDDDSDEADG